VSPFESVVIPHPFEPIAVDYRSAGRGQQRSLERQRRRRAEILATTRRLLAEAGGDRLTLRRVANECEVTAQTLRNSFGRKEELIAQAVNEHTSIIWLRLAEPRGEPLVFLAFSDVIHQFAVNVPDFLRGTISAAFTNSPSLHVLQTHAARSKTRLLRGIASKGLLRPDIDIGLLADQITQLDTMLMHEWSRTGDDRLLREKMTHSHQVMLRGALRPSVAERLADLSLANSCH